MALFVFVGTLFIFLALGVPVAVALGACAIVLMFHLNNFSTPMMAQQMMSGINSFVLMAIPFFMLAGEIMSRGGLVDRIIDAANLLVGRIRGGLGYANVMSSVLLSGLNGSPVADVAMSGSVLYPVMKKKGYRSDRSMGAICASAVIAAVIPPSIALIIMGTTVGLSITRLFMGGIVPGLVMSFAMMVAWFYVVRKDGLTDTIRFTRKETIAILKNTLPALGMPVIIIGGIRFGIFTPTEAGAFAVVYALIISVGLYRELSLKDFAACCLNAAKNTSMVMFIIASATAVGWLIAIAQIPAQVVQLFDPFIGNPLLLLLSINLFLLLVGMVIDLTPAILIFAPVLFPVITAAGIDPHYFGIIMILNLSISLITPPVGNVLLMGVAVSNVPVLTIVKGSLPFILSIVGIIALFILFPSLVMIPMEFLSP